MNEQSENPRYPVKAYYTKAEAAAILGIPRARIHKVCQMTIVPGYGKPKVPLREIERLLNNEQ